MHVHTFGLLIITVIQLSLTFKMSSRRDRRTGLNTLSYTKVGDLEITVAGAPFRFVSVKLDCDYKLTPFCDTPS